MTLRVFFTILAQATRAKMTGARQGGEVGEARLLAKHHLPWSLSNVQKQYFTLVDGRVLLKTHPSSKESKARETSHAMSRQDPQDSAHPMPSVAKGRNYRAPGAPVKDFTIVGQGSVPRSASSRAWRRQCYRVCVCVCVCAR